MMAQWVPISRERHGGLRYRPLSTYKHAESWTVVPVVLAELGRVVSHYPLVLVRREDASFGLCALLGLAPGRNLFVDVNHGRWRAEYIPAAVRAYPFRLSPVSESNQWVLCVDEEAGVLQEGASGLPLFDEGGGPASWVQEVFSFLRHLADNERRTAAACAVLDATGLIVPWPLAVRTPHGDRKVEGLYQVDQGALQQADGGALQKLRDTGALAVFFAQRFSAWHVRTLGRLLGQEGGKTAPQEEGPPVTPTGELDLSFLGE
ncbi:SapC family protein [Desulfosoma caldarium]|uniref:SapC protein n=1 Tax=Desulfosoma caldarium TaxID=610254 RepID=A0A3N1VML9_9BACT|nr:SapC family protein [Desulfosoma caldarium]ROR03200.1 SapC protein [Desulfosoma caldarium]